MAMPRLSVNLNKIALLRNSRRTGVPDVMRFGRIAHDAGADGLTAHPRPDERHIRRTDVFALAELMTPWRPGFELNLEGYPDRRFLDIVAAAKPEQCTLVPDSPDAFTSEEGWKLDAAQHRLVDAALNELKPLGCRVILFVDPDPAAVALVHNNRRIAGILEIHRAAVRRSLTPGRAQDPCESVGNFCGLINRGEASSRDGALGTGTRDPAQPVPCVAGLKPRD
jgi:pyridoxine 5-phosphate synthase